jgi:hypothetical protein
MVYGRLFSAEVPRRMGLIGYWFESTEQAKHLAKHAESLGNGIFWADLEFCTSERCLQNCGLYFLHYRKQLRKL